MTRGRRLLLTAGSYIATLALAALGVFLWTHHIEHRIDQRIATVVIRQGRDHRHIVAIEEGKPARSFAAGEVMRQTPTHNPGQQPAPPAGGAQHHPEPQPAPELPAPQPEPAPGHPGPIHTTVEAATEHAESIVNQTPAGPLVETAHETACSVNALGVHVCTPQP